MNLRELAAQINSMSPAQQEQVALIQEDNTGEFVELLGFNTDEESQFTSIKQPWLMK